MPLKLNSTGGGSVTLDTPSTAGTYTVTVPASNQTLGITSGTAVTASGTAVDFTSIPSWVKRITVMFNGVSTSGTSSILLQLGDSGGIENTGYLSYGCRFAGASLANGVNNTSGFVISGLAATYILSGSISFSYFGSNTWCANGLLAETSASNGFPVTGAKTLSGTLDRIRITTVNGTDTFDAGTINIMYEG